MLFVFKRHLSPWNRTTSKKQAAPHLIYNQRYTGYTPSKQWKCKYLIKATIDTNKCICVVGAYCFPRKSFGNNEKRKLHFGVVVSLINIMFLCGFGAKTSFNSISLWNFCLCQFSGFRFFPVLLLFVCVCGLTKGFWLWNYLKLRVTALGK